MANPKPFVARDTDIDWLARARVLAPLIEAEAGRTEADGKVTAAVMDAMHEAALFRLCLPRSTGGAEASPMTIFAVVQAIAAADASTAWCLGQGLGCSLAAGFITPEAAREVFGAPDAVLAWGPISMTARAVAVDGGYRLSGNWNYTSGLRNATWLGAHCPQTNEDGSPKIGPSGRPVIRTFLFPAECARVTPNWDVIGLKGTGSDDFSVSDLFVPDALTYRRDEEEDRYEAGPLYRIALTAFYGMTFAAVALGIARAMLDSFIALAAVKTASHTRITLRDSTSVQSQVAFAEGQIGASRAYLAAQTADIWQALSDGRTLTIDQRARFRIACAFASRSARDVVQFAYHNAGAGAIQASNPFERRFRDAHAVSQQIQAAPSNFEQAGAAILGLEAGGRV